MSNEKQVDTGRRGLLVATCAAGGVVGVSTAGVLVSTFQPSERAKAAGAPVEVDFCKDRPLMPQVLNNASLNCLAYPAASVSGVTVMGTTHYVWSS